MITSESLWQWRNRHWVPPLKALAVNKAGQGPDLDTGPCQGYLPRDEGAEYSK